MLRFVKKSAQLSTDRQMLAYFFRAENIHCSRNNYNELLALLVQSTQHKNNNSSSAISTKSIIATTLTPPPPATAYINIRKILLFLVITTRLARYHSRMIKILVAVKK
eukprot:scaffold68082_cov91-Cyclotella_meneghiniana.AAC.4